MTSARHFAGSSQPDRLCGLAPADAGSAVGGAGSAAVADGFAVGRQATRHASRARARRMATHHVRPRPYRLVVSPNVLEELSPYYFQALGMPQPQGCWKIVLDILR